MPISLEKAWDFITDPRNLQLITPDFLGFKIISGADKPLHEGQIIRYRVTPILGIPAKWVSEITHVKDKHYFIDEQKEGPYALWHHQHFLKEIPGGVEMEDVIDYQLPMGFLGELAHPFFVKPKLDEIFNYRRSKLIKLFGEFK